MRVQQGHGRNVYVYRYQSFGPTYWFDTSLMGQGGAQWRYRVRLVNAHDAEGQPHVIPLVDRPETAEPPAADSPKLYSIDADSGWNAYPPGPLPGDPGEARRYFLQWTVANDVNLCHRAPCPTIPIPLPESDLTAGIDQIGLSFGSRSYQDVDLSDLPDLDPGTTIRFKRITGTRNGNFTVFYIQQPYSFALFTPTNW